jgi:hypothetical protein
MSSRSAATSAGRQQPDVFRAAATHSRPMAPTESRLRPQTKLLSPDWSSDSVVPDGSVAASEAMLGLVGELILE